MSFASCPDLIIAPADARFIAVSHIISLVPSTTSFKLSPLSIPFRIVSPDIDKTIEFCNFADANNTPTITAKVSASARNFFRYRMPALLCHRQIAVQFLLVRK